MLWNSIPTTGAAADLVLGQPGFVTSTANQAGGGSLQSLYNPYDVKYDGTHLVVSDRTNARILIWNTFPTVNQQAASLSTSACSAKTLYSDGTSLFSGTFAFNASIHQFRVCVWNTFPTTTNQNYDRVIGQSDTNSQNAMLGTTGLSGNVSISGSGNKYFILDSDFARLLIYTNAP